MRISKLEPGDKQQVIALLSAAGLPTSDVENRPSARFLVAHDGESLVGAIALESFGTDALLRSLVVTPNRQRHGLGTQLVEAAERLAIDENIRTLYLLTDTAQEFFKNRGYRGRARDRAPEAIRSHPQFRSLCPSSATLMCKRLEATQAAYRVLFLCTGNSARSVLAEALLNHLAEGRFVAFSAGSHPTGQVNPLAIEVLQQHGIPAGSARSKSWGEFALANAEPMDIVITVCDEAAGESCPIWPGRPLTAHWGVQDPAIAEGAYSERLAAFDRAFAILESRIKRLVELPIDTMDSHQLGARLSSIGSQ